MPPELHPWIAALPLPWLSGLAPLWTHSLDGNRWSGEGLLTIPTGSQPRFVTPTGIGLVFPSYTGNVLAFQLLLGMQLTDSCVLLATVYSALGHE